jgi:cysteinyl-tRNA synthetase
MATTLIGQTLDIHSGGEDLKFPHHENELAQSEALCQSSQWVNYFLHTGHLTINGLKMSKSLKNFISIKDILLQMSARQVFTIACWCSVLHKVRLLFLLKPWEKTIHYVKEVAEEVLYKEKVFVEFFLHVESVLREQVGIPN